MNFKKCIFAIVMFGFLSSLGLCLPKKCCKTEFQRSVEDIVRTYLSGQLNRKLIEKIYRDRLSIEKEGNAFVKYDLGCYKIQIDYSNSKAKNDDLIPESFWLFAKVGDYEALPLSVFFDLCGNEEHYEPRTEITKALFKYTEGDSPYIIRILAKNVYVFEPKLRNGSAGMIELTRYPKSWDEVK